MKVWAEVEINKAKKADRIMNSDFGKLGCVNAAYGRPHERAALDLMPVKRSAMAAEVAEVLMKAVDVEEELISTQGVKKRPREGPGYFGWNKSSGSCSGVHDINVNDYISSGLMCSTPVMNNEWEDSQRREREEKERQEKADKERQEREEKERQDKEEKDRLEREEKERLEREEIERLEREERKRLEKEERERLAREKKERLAREEKERLEREEAERVEKEQEELDRLEKEKEEFDRLKKKEREERDRLGKKKVEKENGENDRSPENRIIRGPQSPERRDQEISFSSEDELTDECGSPSSMFAVGERSRRKRKATATPSRLVQGYVITWRPRKNRRYQQTIFYYVKLNTNFSPRRQHIEIEEDPMMLRCDGHVARLSLCAGIALSKGQVVDQYVRVAARMYEKVWAHQFEGRSRRFMLDPAFANRVLNMKSPADLDRTTKVYTRQMSGLSPNRINVVFVPVVLANHWWCVAFSLNREEILVMDSMETSTAADLHSLNVQKLAYAMDLVFQLLDESWPLGTVGNWTKSSLRMDQQGDMHSCGVHMLAAIKRNAERLLTDLRLGSRYKC